MLHERGYKNKQAIKKSSCTHELHAQPDGHKGEEFSLKVTTVV